MPFLACNEITHQLSGDETCRGGDNTTAAPKGAAVVINRMNRISAAAEIGGAQGACVELLPLREHLLLRCRFALVA